ncbi:homeobox-leucine zipper protein HDG2-like [Impatiens glandulifera]|uniref:homeobox-leucine zipper protein HDG2-like n=1 Tax=Impatiens glandulifera TaxID=253017 RepID=UPI001FB05D28|nr:homeobox-leucine zipper protein HDG2-like [Impatiens glandulifera]
MDIYGQAKHFKHVMNNRRTMFVGSTSGHAHNGASSSGHALNGASTSGHALNGASTSGHALIGASSSGHALNGASTSGHALIEASSSGHALNDASTSGHALIEASSSGHALNGASTSGHALIEASSSGHALNGALTSGHALIDASGHALNDASGHSLYDDLMFGYGFQKPETPTSEDDLLMNILYPQIPNRNMLQELGLQVNTPQEEQNYQMNNFNQQTSNMNMSMNTINEDNPPEIGQIPVDVEEMWEDIRGAEREFDEVEAVEAHNEEQVITTGKRKRKTYRRHSREQIEALESFYKNIPNPNKRQRQLLGHEIGMEHLQVKFWFQNKRTQSKTTNERNVISQLSKDNERLKFEVMRYNEALEKAKTTCPICGGPKPCDNTSELLLSEHNLHAHNAHIEKTTNNISSGRANHNIAQRQPPTRQVDIVNAPPSSNVSKYPWGDQPNKNMIVRLANVAMDELDKLAQIGYPMWTQSVGDELNELNELNETEYKKVLEINLGPHIENLKCESSRHSKGFYINPLDLIDILLDMKKWKRFFHAIVAKASTMEVWSTGTEGTRDGALQMINVELHALSPLVPTRKNMLARYCKKFGEGRWGIVDFSVDFVRSADEIKCRKRPSGCIIEVMGNGVTRVTWIEHVEVDDSNVHVFYKPLVNSRLAFGAKRWLSILGKQTDRLGFFQSTLLPHNDTMVTSLVAKRNITKLAQRMVEGYNVAVSSAVDKPWSLVENTAVPLRLPVPNQTRVIVCRNTTNPNLPLGIVLSASNSFWLPAPPKDVFDFLRNKETRSKWDLISNHSNLEEISCLVLGRDDNSHISMLKMNEEVVILQEINWDPLEAYLIFAPIDIQSLNMAMNGGDSEYVSVLSSGFVVVPDGPEANGSLVTTSFQFLVDICPTAMVKEEYIQIVTNLVNETMNNLKTRFSN